LQISKDTSRPLLSSINQPTGTLGEQLVSKKGSQGCA